MNRQDAKTQRKTRSILFQNSEFRIQNFRLILLLVLVVASPCLAWNSTGHEIVAQIALDQLSPGARARIVSALLYHPRLTQDLLQGIAPGEDPERAIFLRAATWPDMIRYPANPLSRTENHPIWHYVDYPFVLDGTVPSHQEPINNNGPGGYGGPMQVVVNGPIAEQWDGKSPPINLLQAMEKARTELADPNTPPNRKAIDLCWVLHLTGDIHQPLHAVSMYSKQYPYGDQGGNAQILRNPGDIIQDVPTINLHALWDDIEGLSLDPAVIRQIADRIEQEHPPDQLKDLAANPDVAAWAKESLELARTQVYVNGTLAHATRDEANMNPDLAPPLPDGYEKAAIATADARIALGGYRLAVSLEEIAKDLDKTPTTAPATVPGR
jgi:hypothetical protein